MADGFFDKMKKVIGIDEDDSDYGGYDGTRYEEPETEKQAPSSSYTDKSNDFVQPTIDPASKVVSMQNAAASSAAKRQQLKMLITEPRGYNDCPRLVDSLRESRPVIINVEKLEREIARKIFDFLLGATYAVNGKVQKISENIILFAPANVDIMSFLSEANDNGSYSTDESMYLRDISWHR